MNVPLLLPHLHVDGGHEPPHLRVQDPHVAEARVVGRVADVERGVGAGQLADSGRGGGGDVVHVVVEPHHPAGVELLHQAQVLSEATRQQPQINY